MNVPLSSEKHTQSNLSLSPSLSLSFSLSLRNRLSLRKWFLPLPCVDAPAVSLEHTQWMMPTRVFIMLVGAWASRQGRPDRYRCIGRRNLSLINLDTPKNSGIDAFPAVRSRFSRRPHATGLQLPALHGTLRRLLVLLSEELHRAQDAADLFVTINNKHQLGDERRRVEGVGCTKWRRPPPSPL